MVTAVALSVAIYQLAGMNAVLRKNYPALGGQTYLKTASCGLVSTATAAAAQQFYQQLLEQGGAARQQWYAQIPLLRQEVADWLGAEAEEVALLPNFSVACNYVARALTGCSRVLLLNSDYSSLTLPWLLPDYQVHYFSAAPNGAIDLNVLEEEVKKHRIEVLAISHVQYASGYCIDLETLGQHCRNWGVVLVVDATQSLGVMPIDLRKLPVDVLMGSGYKWMTAGFGNALLFVRGTLHHRLAVPAVGNNSFDEAPRVRVGADLSFSARLLEVGHYDFASLWALRQAVGEPAIGRRFLAQREVAQRDIHRAIEHGAGGRLDQRVSYKEEAGWGHAGVIEPDPAGRKRPPVPQRPPAPSGPLPRPRPPRGGSTR